MLLHFLKGSKRFFIASVIFSAFVSVFDLIAPKIVAFTVDNVLTDSVNETGCFAARMSSLYDRLKNPAAPDFISFLKTHLYLIALLLIAVALLRGLSRYLFSFLIPRAPKGLWSVCETFYMTISFIFR